jgi:hypothetical protein
MNGKTKAERRSRLTGLPRSGRAGSARPRPPKSASPTTRGDGGLSRDLREWAHTPARIPWPEGAVYQYRLGSHRLVLATCGGASRHDAAVGRAEAEFSLIVEGPLLVLGSRFGDTRPGARAAPYNWHFAPPAERVVPAAVPLTPETYARLWATLWIALADTATGRDRIGRAVALRPEFKHALQGLLREQAMRPFRVAAADRALDGLRCATDPLELRARARTRCAAVSDHGGRWASTQTRRDAAAQDISTRKLHDSRLGHRDRRHRRALDAHPPYSNPPPSLPGTPGGRTDARRCGEPPGESTELRPRFRPRQRA